MKPTASPHGLGDSRVGTYLEPVREPRLMPRFRCPSLSPIASNPSISMMDWDSDNAILGEHNLNNVFAFESKPTTVVRLLDIDKVRARWHSHVQDRELNLANSNIESLSGARNIIFRG